MINNIVQVGNKGERVRSDCFVSLERTESGGLIVQPISKVNALYGKNIGDLARKILTFFGISDAVLTIEDSGALPFVLAARIEAAVKLLIASDKEYLLELIPENRYQTPRDRQRISRLYLPGNTPSLMINAGIHHPDGIILDLEDAVAPDRKYEARFLVRNALRQLDFYGAERMVRINQVPIGLDDLEFLVPHNVNLILVPKCESSLQIQQVNERIRLISDGLGVQSPIWLMPILESALGVVKAYEIATAAENVVAMAIGLEDYTADLGTRRTVEGNESFFARCQLVVACRAAGIQAIDSVFSDVDDMEGLRQTILRSKALGYDGMGCIHPRQIRVIHENYAPEKDEIEKAKRIVRAFDEAEAKGLGVVSLGSKMIDPPVVKRALKTITTAIRMGKLSQNWREEE